MKFVIKAADGTYKREPGDSLSSRYDDEGYTCYDLDSAVLYDSYQSARSGLHEKGKFSLVARATVQPVVLVEAELPVFNGEDAKAACRQGWTVGHVGPGAYRLVAASYELIDAAMEGKEFQGTHFVGDGEARVFVEAQAAVGDVLAAKALKFLEVFGVL